MVYMGSKDKLSKYLLPFIIPLLDDETWYVEPFCGGCNMLAKVRHPLRIAADAQPYLIALWKALQEGWEPPMDIGEEETKRIRDNKKDYPEKLVGWVGFTNSFRGTFFGGYSRLKMGFGSKTSNYRQTYQINVLRQIARLKDVRFHHCSYDELEIPDNSVVYCDPPYADVSSYKETQFDTHEFWEWVRQLSKRVKRVYVSEYSAPLEFDCVWERKAKVRLGDLKRIDSSFEVTERLFTLNT